MLRRSVRGLVQTAMVCVAVERLIRYEALAARQVHPAVSAPHHVFTALSIGLACASVYFSFVGFQYPVDEDEDGDEKKNFSQAAFREKAAASLPHRAAGVEAVLDSVT